jgi:hypothetical protein
MKLSTARQLSLIVCTAALCAAASVDHRLDGFRAAPPVDGAPQASNLLEQARLSLAVTDATTKEAVLRELVAFQRGGIGSFLKYMVAQQVANQALQQFLTTLENLRTDKQNGGGPNTAGSTSLVSLPGAPAVLSAAVESGAVTQSTGNGPQTTFRGNLVGIGRLLLAQDQFPFCVNIDPKTQKPPKSCDSGIVRVLKPFSFSVSTDANGKTTNNVPVTGNATTNSSANPSSLPSSVNLAGNSQRVSAWTARYTILNPRALDSQQNRTTFANALSDTSTTLLTNLNVLLAKPTQEDPKAFFNVYRDWVASAVKRLAVLPPTTTSTQFEAAFAEQLDLLIQQINSSDPLWAGAWKSLEAYFGARETALESLNQGTIVTLEYINNKPLNQPATSDVRAIVSWQASNSISLTANAAFTIYNSLPVGAVVSRFRDAQASAQVDFSMGQLGTLGSPTLSAAGYFQYMHDPALINITNADLAPGTNISLPSGAATVLGQKGNIAIAQLKFTLPFKSTGVKFPVAVTWANRTELIKANDVSGHIGVSFDLDTLLAKAK